MSVLMPPFFRAIVLVATLLAADVAQAQQDIANPLGPLFAPSRATLLGDAGGVRSTLARVGITLSMTDINEAFGNMAGGIKRGAAYQGLSTLTMQLDTKKAFGWDGGLFNISGLQIRGHNFSQFHVGDLQTTSGIAATPTTRLWEAWYQQQIIEGKLDVRLGMQSIDQEFIASAGSAIFLNTMMGWPMLPSADLYAGGPAYPLSSLGARLKAQEGAFTVLAGVFQDNPPGGPFANDGQLRGSSRWGGNFNLRTGALFIAEIQYAHNQPSQGAPDAPGTQRGLPGTYKLGFWYDTAGYPDQRIDTRGLSLANPGSSGVARTDRGNFSLYAVIDQTVWQLDPDGPMAVSAFLRPMIAPSDRNQINFSVNGGLTLKAPLPGRDSDTLGLGFGVASIGDSTRGFAQDLARFSGAYVPGRGPETFVELTYQAQIANWWQIQPDIQYRWRTGGGVVDPNRPGKALGNALIIGVRNSITF
jgi:porin